MPEIAVRRLQEGGPFRFEVTVTEGSGATTHRVTLDQSDFERLRRQDEGPERFVHRCIEFLLAREPKESILGSFDVSVISSYFPEFEAEIAK